MLLDNDPLLAGTSTVAARVASQVVTCQSDQSGGAKRQWGGSKKGKAPNIGRDFVGAHKQLANHCFSGESSLCNEEQFERRFRMKRAIFDKIFGAAHGNQPFTQRQDAAKKDGIHPLCRLVACLRVLAHGNAADAQDEHLQVSETATKKSLKDFCRLMIKKFGPQCLNRSPTRDEVRGLMKKMEARGFPGCFASWDCKHFDWSSCPVWWQGQHQSKEKKRTIVMEAIADVDHCIWHVFWQPRCHE